MDNRYKRLGKNTVLVFIGKAGGALISFLMLPFYTKWLTTAEYGTTDLIITYSTILTSFFSCCIYDSIFIFPKDANSTEKKEYYTSGFVFLSFSALVFIILAAIALLSSSRLGIHSVFFDYIWLLLALTICASLQNYTQSFTRAIDKMVVYSGTGVVFVATIALSSWLLIPRYRESGFLWAYIISNFIAALFSLVSSGSYKYIDITKFEISKIKVLLIYGIPLIPNGVMWWLVNGINRPVMESTLGLSAIGIFAVASKLPSVVTMLCGIFNSAWTITMLEEFGKKDFNEFFNRMIKAIFFLMIFCGCILSILSKPLIEIFADDAFIDAWHYVPLLTFSVIVQNLSGLIGGVFAAEKQSKYFFYSSIYGAVTSVIFTWGLANIAGLYGIAISMILSFVVMAIVRLKYAWKYISKFSIKYYMLVSSLYLILSYVTICTLSLPLKILFDSMILLALCYLNKDGIKLSYIKIKEIVKNRI